MVHLSRGMKAPASPHLLSEPAIIAGMARASLPESATPWEEYVDDYDRIRDTMAQVLDGFDGLQRARARAARLPHPPAGARARLRHPVGPCRVLDCATAGRRSAEDGRLDPGDDAFARPVEHDDLLHERPLPRSEEPAHARLHEPRRHGRARTRRVRPGRRHAIGRTEARRSVYGYTALAYDIPPGNAAGYMPELNVLCPLGDFSEQSDQPLMKHLVVEIAPAATGL